MSDDFEFSEGDEPPPEPTPEPRRRARRLALPEPAAEPQGVPHSRETEEYLLSCCFLDGETTIDRCRQAGISARSFHLPAHQIVFEAIEAARAAGKPVDVALISEDLRQSRQLEQIGGLPGLMELSGRLATTAQASDFIQTVRRLEIRRKVLRHATDLQEKCRNGVEIGDLVAVFRGAGQDASDELDSLAPENRLTLRENATETDLKEPDSIFTLAGTTICTPGNLTSIFAQAKAGKSAFIGAMISAAMTNPTAGHDCLGIVGPNYAGHALIHLDTEQSPFDAQQVIRRAKKRIALEKTPPWLRSYRLKGMQAADARLFLEQAMREAQRIFGGIKAVIIDGTADLVVDPNDAEECFPWITRLEQLAIDYSTAIVNVIHMNPGAENAAAKGRGHLGSQLERKSESNLVMEKDADGVTRVWGTKQRGKMITKADGPAYRWDEKEKRHVGCANSQEEGGNDGPSAGRPRAHHLATYRDAFPKVEAEARTRPQLWRMAQDLGDVSDRTFRDLITEHISLGVVRRKHDGRAFRFWWPD